MYEENNRVINRLIKLSIKIMIKYKYHKYKSSINIKL